MRVASNNPKLLLHRCEYRTGTNVTISFVEVPDDKINYVMLAWDDYGMSGIETNRSSIYTHQL
jgi:hypothetical protein